ncbi:hypothetical protein [Dactylosporangium sp. NPDC005555]|uniref:hypothetical protein n=1 Tax=Dactylosporangium sp. NPDC005555 TaxID=3154889 RepID=UPI0033AF185D
MGILDHARTWQIETTATPDECVRVFADCLSGRGGALMGSAWRVSTTSGEAKATAVATYEGRTGVVGALTSMSQRAQYEQGAALGSRLTLSAHRGRGGRTTCTMAMTETSKVLLVFTADARFFRSAMHRVLRRLRAHDPSLALLKQ